METELTHINTTEDTDILCTFPLIAPMVWAPSSVGCAASFRQQGQRQHLLF